MPILHMLFFHHGDNIHVREDQYIIMCEMDVFILLQKPGFGSQCCFPKLVIAAKQTGQLHMIVCNFFF